VRVEGFTREELARRESVYESMAEISLLTRLAEFVDRMVRAINTLEFARG
jgi:hypothetical protein